MIEDISNQMYCDLIDFTASFLYANTEAEDRKHLYNDFDWFMKFIIKYNGIEHVEIVHKNAMLVISV